MAAIRPAQLKGVTSPGTLDFIYGANTSSFGRLAAGSALQVPRINAAGTGWEFGSAASSVAVYAATLANVANTVAETTILSFTIPANSMSDGDTINIRMYALAKNNKGTSGTCTVKMNAGAGAQVSYTAGTFTNSAQEYSPVYDITLMRCGSSVAALYNYGQNGGPMDFTAQLNTIAPAAAYPGYGISTPTNFTSDFAISFKATLSEANATFYLKPQSAKIVHYKS